MPNYARAFLPGGTFFLTLVTYRRRVLFDRADVIERLREALRSVRRERPFGVAAGVVLPDHLHLL